VIDRTFDAHLPEPLRFVSWRFWTPVTVAVCAAQWLAQAGVRRVLDVGSGPGKFCVVAALARDLSFVGLEQRGHLVDAARSLAARFDLGERVSFIHGSLGDVRLEDFDALYFYNPFAENIFCEEDQLDRSVELDERRFAQDVLFVENALERMPTGTRILTYCGFGGRIPDTYELSRWAKGNSNHLRMWTKVRIERQGRHWIERDDVDLIHDTADRAQYDDGGRR
jgi:SAM-dependent methyltransferase